MIDWAQASALKDEVGAEDFDEVVTLFLEEVEEITDRLRQAVDPNTLEADLHFLKGSALSLGFAAFSTLCGAGEALAANGRAAEVEVSAILDCYDGSKRLFLEEMPKSLAG